jgi:DNA-binding CsgD family transcriptional regulator
MPLPVKRNQNGYRIGQSHQRSRYTDHEVELVRQLATGGMRARDIAAKMGMSKGHVSKILRYLARA